MNTCEPQKRLFVLTLAAPFGGRHTDAAIGIPNDEGALKQAGIDQLIQGLQTQIDLWKKANNK